MVDSEAIKRYINQIAEDAARFEESFGSAPASIRNVVSHDIMSRRIPAASWVDEPARQEHGTDVTNMPPANDLSNDGYRNARSLNRQNVTREVSEALGHELSIQRRMRGL